jgi:TPR repeat protein
VLRKDYSEAMRCYKKAAAEADCPDAYAYIGALHYYRLGAPIDYNQALVMSEKAEMHSIV